MENSKTKKLILNGDVFDSQDFRRLKKSHWKILSTLRKLSDHIEIIWIIGNHDGEDAETVSHLVGTKVVENYILVSGDKKILCQHGHLFDEFITKRPIISELSDWIYRLIQKIDKKHHFCKWLKNKSKTYLRCSDKIKVKSLKYSRDKNCDISICGHTHKAENFENIYFNSGSWTELPCYFITIKNGVINLNEFQ